MVTSPAGKIQGDTLTLDGRILEANRHSVQDLEHVLRSVGREAIVDTIEALYEETQAANPDVTVTPPSLRAMILGASKQNVLSTFGQRNRTGVHRSIVELHPDYRDYWNAIQGFDLTPEVRNMSSASKSEQWLLLRNPDTDPAMVTLLDHLPRALGFIEPAATRVIKPQLLAAHEAADAELYRSLWDELHTENEAAIDRQAQSFDAPDVRSAAQIGLIVSNATLRSEEIGGQVYTLDENGYSADLHDAEEYAYQIGLDDVATFIAMEIERVAFLRQTL